MLKNASTTALLLYGIGGAGKSTLAERLYFSLLQGGRFSGGSFRVTVQRQFLIGADIAGLARQAQQELLASVLGRPLDNAISSLSMDAGREQLALAFSLPTAPVLLMVDNVPESLPGIRGMLPHDLCNILPQGQVSLVWVLLTFKCCMMWGLRRMAEA